MPIADIDISIGFDPFAFIIAVVAIWFTYHESRRNNQVLLKIEDIRCAGERSNHEAEFNHYLRVRIRNLGRSLHWPGMSLTFRGEDGFGITSIPFKNHERTGKIEEFARGMVAEFTLDSRDIPRDERCFFEWLKSPGKQDARLNVYSQRYLVKSFRVGKLRDRLAVVWNRVAYRFNLLFDRKVKTNSGTVGLTGVRILPQMHNRRWEIEQFCRAMTRDATA